MAMQRVDLSQPYAVDMPRFAGMAAPDIELLAVVEQHGFGMERQELLAR